MTEPETDPAPPDAAWVRWAPSGAQAGTPTPPQRVARAVTPSDADDPVLPTVTRDEQALGWGDEPGERDADWYRRERPPHHE